MQDFKALKDFSKFERLKLRLYTTIILPKTHHVTFFIVCQYHERHFHQNPATVLNELTQPFSIPSLRVLLKSYLVIQM